MPYTLPLVELLGQTLADGALFTTFTLSLTWFEAYLLRPLEQRGVARVSILADPHGVEQSLKERLAAGPGLRYSVSSVPCDGGSFHPKVCLLWTADTLVLAVGSGNLTLPGMLRNLEVYELLVHGVPDVPETHMLNREVADGLLVWLGGLLGELPRQDPARRTIEQARQAVQGLRGRLPSNPDLRWLDTFQGSIGAQWVANVGPAAGSGPRRLDVLSPFHDPTGDAVRRLARDVGATSVTVLGTASTTFPLSRARGWTEPVVRASRLAEETWHAGESARPLHAKVVRLRDDAESWLLSGSANLTQTGFWSQKNVEVSLLRRGAPGAWDALLATGPGSLDEVKDEMGEPPARPLQILSARTSGADVVVAVRCAGTPPQTVRAGLGDDDGILRSLPWSEGELRWPLPPAWTQRRPEAVQVMVEAELDGALVVARAWLAQEDWLDASPRWRRASVAWGRLLSRNAPGEEDAELLRMFAAEHVRTMRSLGSMGARRRAGAGTTDGGGSERQETSVPLEVLLMREGVNRAAVGGAAEGSAGTIQAVQRAMLAAFRRLGDPIESDEPAPDDIADGDERGGDSPDGGSEGSPLPPPVREALAEFERAFWDACAGLTEAPQQPALVMSYLGMVNQLAVRLRSKDGEPETALWATVDRMVRAVCCARPSMGAPPVLTLLRSGEEPAPPEVLNLLVGQIAVLHWRSSHGARWTGLSGEALREALTTVQASFPKGAQVSPALPPSLRRSVDIDGSLHALLGDLKRIPSPSLRPRWLAWARRQVHLRKTEPRSLPAPPGEKLTREELRLVRLPDGKVHAVFPWTDICPRCHMSLSQAVRRELAAHRPQPCSGICRGVLLPSEGV